MPEPTQPPLDYLFKLAAAVPEGRWLVHNQVYPVTRRHGTRGSRYWLSDPDPNLEPCDCGFAPELGTHYRRRPPGPGTGAGG
jgi:hypothetical protein